MISAAMAGRLVASVVTAASVMDLKDIGLSWKMWCLIENLKLDHRRRCAGGECATQRWSEFHFQIKGFCPRRTCFDCQVRLCWRQGVEKAKGAVRADMNLAGRLPVGIHQNGNGALSCAQYGVSDRGGRTTCNGHCLACQSQQKGQG